MGENCSNNSYEDLVILEGSLNGIGVVICAIAIILTFFFRLHKLLIYRLSIYQVSSAMAYGMCSALTVIEYVTMPANNTTLWTSVCYASAYLGTYIVLVKLFFTIIISVHLFVFAVCYKNLKLETCYVVTSLVVPAAMAAVPFITHTYGQQDFRGPWCWIQEESTGCPPKTVWPGVIEVYSLTYGPITVSLLVVTLLVGVMLGVLLCRVHCRVSRTSTKNKTAIRQMLPLVAYPIIFYLLMSISMVKYIYDAMGLSKEKIVLKYVDRFLYGGIIWAAGLTLLVHILVVLWLEKKTVRYRRMVNSR